MSAATTPALDCAGEDGCEVDPARVHTRSPARRGVAGVIQDAPFRDIPFPA